MSEEQRKAYEEAKKVIWEAKASSAPNVFLSSLRNLSILPPEIAELNAVRWLFLNENRISDLSPIGALVAMTSLDLSDTDVADLFPLGNLYALSSLNLSRTKVSDLSGLSGLSALRSLDLLATRVVDLSPLRSLVSLSAINLDSTPVTDLSPLHGLSRLRRVILSECAALPRLGLSERTLAGLETLFLGGCNLADVPLELCRKGRFENVAPEVHAYFRALREQGAGRLNECKLVLLGNGRAGKTSLMKALKGEPFQADEASTHAIRLWPWERTVQFAETAVPEPARISAWDFGGQDIYHQSHRLFLRTRAVFLVVWNAWEETDRLRQQGDEPHPLAYWLEQIAASHADPRILLVRTHADEDAAQLAARGLDAVPEWQEHVPEPFRALECMAISALDAERASVEPVHAWLDAALAAEMSAGSRQVPRGWVEVHGTLRALQAENEQAHAQGRRPPHAVLSAEGFAAIVEENLPPTATARDPAEVRGFLHDIGALFYDARLGGRIVLDQRWAIEGLYAILQPGPAREWLRERGGTFTARELAPQWTARSYTPEEQSVLLEFMRACGQAVEIMCAEETAAGEAVYLAPTLLPTREELAETLPSVGPPGKTNDFSAADPALSRDVAQEVIVRAVREFGRSGRYWRWGAQVSNASSGLVAEFEWKAVDGWSYGGAIEITLAGPQKATTGFIKQWRQTLAQMLGRSLDRFGIGAGLPDFAPADPHGLPARTEDREDVAVRGKTAFLTDSPPDRATVTGRRLSFSIAGESSDHPGLEGAPLALFEAVKAEAETLGWEVFCYKRSTDRPDVQSLLRHVGKSDFVTVFLSRKFLRSEYCMEELRLVYDAEPRGTFPLATARLFGFAGWRPANVDEWLALEEEWKAALKKKQDEWAARYKKLFPAMEKAREIIEHEPAYGWFRLCLDDGELALFQRAVENYAAIDAPLPFDPADPKCRQWLAEWKAKLLARLRE